MTVSACRPALPSRRAGRACAPALAGLFLVLGCAQPTVVRVIDGREVEGRFISEYAYTLYAIAIDAEAHGDLETAREAFEAAAIEDEDSPEIWTGVGAVRCRLSLQGGSAGSSEEAFARARELDPEYEPLHREQASCALAKGRLAEAIGHAARAVELDPDRDETTLLYAAILEAMGRTDEARRAMRALTIRRPTSVGAWRRLLALALRTRDVLGAAEAQEKLGSLGQLDAALAAGDLAEARRLGKRARLPSAELAVRAAALGRGALAREQAELVLGADPSEGSARIALSVAADLADDTDLLARALEAVPKAPSALMPPSPLARLLFAELLARRASKEAARAWLGPRSGPASPPAGKDPLFDRVEKRVRERLGT